MRLNQHEVWLEVAHHEVWLEVAHTVAQRSRCVRSQVGCVLVDADDRIISTGYNGPPAGYALAKGRETCAAFCPRHDTEYGKPDFSDCPSVHAELNALLYSERSRRIGGVAYITRAPCTDCAKALAASGLKTVIWTSTDEDEDYADREHWACRFFEACGMRYRTL